MNNLKNNSLNLWGNSGIVSDMNDKKFKLKKITLEGIEKAG